MKFRKAITSLIILNMMFLFIFKDSYIPPSMPNLNQIHQT